MIAHIERARDGVDPNQITTALGRDRDSDSDKDRIWDGDLNSNSIIKR
jgi:hypothetical protein